nr:MAG TPA: hypothetical protein [Caudoviricetes sp.]
MAFRVSKTFIRRSARKFLRISETFIRASAQVETENQRARNPDSQTQKRLGASSGLGALSFCHCSRMKNSACGWYGNVALGRYKGCFRVDSALTLVSVRIGKRDALNRLRIAHKRIVEKRTICGYGIPVTSWAWRDARFTGWVR